MCEQKEGQLSNFSISTQTLALMKKDMYLTKKETPEGVKEELHCLMKKDLNPNFLTIACWLPKPNCL